MPKVYLDFRGTGQFDSVLRPTRTGAVEPAPSFSVQPSIGHDGTPVVGELLTGNDGTILNGVAYLREWILGGVVVATTSTYTPPSTGDYTYRVYAVGSGGITQATSTPITVALLPTTLAPSSQWTGTAASGYGGANPPAPSDPARTTAKPVARLLNVDYEAFSGDLTLVVAAEAKGGISSVEFFCEGNSQTIATPSWTAYTDVNGASKSNYGYACTLDGNAARALSASGTLQVFARVTASDGTMQQRVIGPFLFYPRNAGVGANCVNDIEIFVDKNLGSSSHPNYNTLQAALNYCAANYATYKLPLVTLIRAGDHVWTGSGATETFARAHWTIIRAASGVTAYVGDGSALRGSAGHQYDGLRFRGSNLKVDLCKISPNLLGFRLRTSSNKLICFEGTDLFMGANTYGQGSGSGMNALWDGVTSSGFWISTQDSSKANIYFVDSDIHDLSGYGPGFCLLARNNTVSNIGGSCFENVHGACVGNTVTAVGGPLAGLRTYLDAINITLNTGTNPNAQISITGNVGANSRVLSVYPDNVTGTPDYTVTLSNVASTVFGSSTATKVSVVVAGLDALSYITATESVQNRAACFLSLQSQGDASPLVRRNIGASMTLDTFVDVHANAIVWHSTTFDNVLVRFNSFDRLVSTNLIGMNSSAGQVNDMAITHIVAKDTSEAEGYGVSGGYINFDTVSHLYFDKITQRGGAQSFGTAFAPGSYSGLYRSHLATTYWAGTPVAFDIQRLSMLYNATYNLPAGSDGNSVERANGVLDTDLFDANFVPIGSQMVLGGQTIGAKIAGGGWNV